MLTLVVQCDHDLIGREHRLIVFGPRWQVRINQRDDGLEPQVGIPANASDRIGLGGVRVPTYLYKLVYDATTGRAWAHWQANREGERVSQPISYAELVRRTGIEFLPVKEP